MRFSRESTAWQGSVTRQRVLVVRHRQVPAYTVTQGHQAGLLGRTADEGLVVKLSGFLLRNDKSLVKHHRVTVRSVASRTVSAPPRKRDEHGL